MMLAVAWGGGEAGRRLLSFIGVKTDWHGVAKVDKPVN